MSRKKVKRRKKEAKLNTETMIGNQINEEQILEVGKLKSESGMSKSAWSTERMTDNQIKELQDEKSEEERKMNSE